MNYPTTPVWFSLACLALVQSHAGAAIVISDSFETNTAANYAVVNDGTPDGTASFGFNYVAAGIPLAPRSAPGSNSGLRLTANDTLAATDALTAFHNTVITGSQYILTVDVYIRFGAGVGTTEHAHVGVGGDGTTFNSLFTPISGSGSYIAFSGDGGSASDYRWYRSAVNSFADDPATAPVIPSTTLPNSHPSYLGRGSNNTGTFFSNTLFPATSGTTVVGSPGNIWTTVKIEVNNGTINYFFNDILTFSGSYIGNFDGKASLGLADTFSGVDTAGVAVIYDNFSVEVVPEAGSLGLLGLASLPLLRRRRR